LMWYFSFPRKQRSNHNLEALGLMALGIVISTVVWSFWLIYDIQGTDELKVSFANKVIMGVMIGFFGTLMAVAVLTLKHIFTKDDKGKKRKSKKI